MDRRLSGPFDEQTEGTSTSSREPSVFESEPSAETTFPLVELSPRQPLLEADSSHFSQGEQSEDQSFRESHLQREGHRCEAESQELHFIDFDHVLGEFWEPFWLRGATLVGCAVAFLITAVAVIALYIVANHRYGLGSYAENTDLVYLWKYIPSALIVGFLSIWNGVDYSARLLQPWLNLKNGPSSADQTLLLDLITPILPRVFWCTLRNKQWIPLLTLLCALLLEFTRILSTGLLQLESISMKRDGFPLETTGVFDTTSWSPKVLDVTSPVIFSGIHNESLTPPLWVLNNATFEPFNMPTPLNSSANSALTAYAAVTKGFFPTLECEEAKMERLANLSSIPSYMANTSIISTSCNIMTELELMDLTQVNRMSRYPSKNFVAHVSAETCLNDEQRYLFAITLANSDFELIQSSALFCKPDYTTGNISVNFDSFRRQLHVDWTSMSLETAKLDGLEPFNLLDNIINSSRSSTGRSVYHPSNTSVNNVPFMNLAALTLADRNPEKAYLEPLLVVDQLETAVRQGFAGMAALTVNQNMLSPVQKPISGKVSYDQSRLQVKAGAATAAGALIMACFFLTLLLFMIRPRRVVPADPRSIGGIVQLVQSSTQLRSIFSSSLQETTSRLRCAKFATRFDAGPDTRFMVMPDGLDQMGNGARSDLPVSQNLKFWRPMGLAAWFRTTAIILPLLIIGILERLQRISDQSHGIATISTTDTVHYAATFVPALVMWGISAMHSSLHFNTTLLSPYHALSKGYVDARCSISSRNIGKLTPLVLFASVSRKHFAASFTAVAAIAGAFLTIFVSGLYSIETSDANSNLLARRTDNFNVWWNDSGIDDGGAGEVLSLINWQNLSYPEWTYEDLALPKISLDQGDLETLTNATRLNATLPARRAILDCEFNGPENVSVEVRASGKTIHTTVSRSCPGSIGDDFPVNITVINSNITGFGGQANLLLESTQLASAWLYTGSHAIPSGNEAGCKSLLFFFGSFSSVNTSNRELPFNLTSREAQVTTLACKQLVQEIDTEVSLLLSDMTINLLQPPIPDEATARFVNDESASGSNVQEYLTAFPMSTFLDVVSNDPSVLANVQSLQGLTEPYKSIVLANGMKPTDLVGRDNIPRLIHATNSMYSRYMAQVMSRKMRTEAPASEQRIPVTINYKQTRLVQNSGSKTALQVLLGVMAACALASCFFMWSTRLVPHDPASIAGVASLLVGSDLWKPDDGVSSMPRGPEPTSSQEGNKSWDKTAFRLGWRADGNFGLIVANTKNVL